MRGEGTKEVAGHHAWGTLFESLTKKFQKRKATLLFFSAGMGAVPLPLATSLEKKDQFCSSPYNWLLCSISVMQVPQIGGGGTGPQFFCFQLGPCLLPLPYRCLYLNTLFIYYFKGRKILLIICNKYS